jgi:16S rRNA (cytidine1402-2'-O)-methyltransferase
MADSKGTLYLIPCPIGDGEINASLPVKTIELLNKVNIFAVEKIRTARRFLLKTNKNIIIDNLVFHELSEHTKPVEVEILIQSLLEGEDVGILSEAGFPAVADPGTNLVRIAHENKIKVMPFSGPSSLIMALSASGLNGQQFTFHGYLPKNREERIKKIKELDNNVLKSGYTQTFIETPYHNDSLLKDLITICKNDTLLCVACAITTPQESINTMSISDWKSDKKSFNDLPAVFLMGR